LAQNVYAAVSDLSVPSKALTEFTTQDLNDALAKASSVADGYIRKRFNLPLHSWTQSLTQAVADIATYWLMKKRGFNPEAESTKLISGAYRDALDWLEEVASNLKVDPAFVDATGAGQTETGATDTAVEKPFVYYSQRPNPWRGFGGGNGGGDCGSGGSFW
jgi:phage gp36-like protein